jgi:hypothetical protein
MAFEIETPDHGTGGAAAARCRLASSFFTNEYSL